MSTHKISEQVKVDVEQHDVKNAVYIVQTNTMFNHINGYDKWCEQNADHLENMYDLSGLDCGIDDFSRWVYNNSVMSNKK